MALHFFGSYKLNIEGVEFDIRIALSNAGVTQIEVPPLGLVQAPTHNTPLKIAVRLESLDLDQIQSFIKAKFDKKQISVKIANNLRYEIRRFISELILMTSVAGFLGVFLFRSRKITEYLLGSLMSVIVIGILLFVTYKDYDINRFSDPQYEGVLKAAPWMIGIAEDALVKIDSLSDKLQLVAENLNSLYYQIDKLQPISHAESTVKVLHISDIHNNPAALEVVRRMAELFEVNFIIDTGDISDFGTPLEGLLTERIGSLKIPYVFIAGNHDSPDIISKMKSLQNNVIVADHIVEIEGIKIAGFHDPASNSNQIKSASPEEEAKHIAKIKSFLKKEFKQSAKPIDIVAVHSPYIARPLAGEAPVLLFGHNHQFNVAEEKNSVLINAGTTGASGLGTLQEINRRPYSVMLLSFYNDGESTQLLAVDSIQIDSETGEFSMQRHLFGSNTNIASTNP